jgi:IclR family transcriptional regulator, KDG regulon repressor
MTDSYIIQPVLRSLLVLEAVAASPVPLTLKQIVADTGMPKTTTFKHVQTLKRAGYLAVEPVSERIQLGIKLLLMAGKDERFAHLREFCLPEMIKLRDNLGETVNLATLEGSEIVYIAVVESRRTLRTHASQGVRDPAHTTAVGRAMLANLFDQEIDKVIPSKPVALTAKTDTDRQSIRDKIATAKVLGYSTETGENEEGVCCIGVAIPTPNGWPTAGISVSGPQLRMAEDRFQDMAGAIADAARSISKKFNDAERSL